MADSDADRNEDYALISQGEEMERSADMSSCGQYRYSLERAWSDGATVAWVMLNPSTADGFEDDPTIRRCIGFSKAWGFGRLIVVNQFGLRSTDPKALLTHPDPWGPHNTRHVIRAFVQADLVVAAWGAHKMPRKTLNLPRVARMEAVPMICLGVTKNGNPRHPLYVRADQERLPWPPRSKRRRAYVPTSADLADGDA